MELSQSFRGCEVTQAVTLGPLATKFKLQADLIEQYNGCVNRFPLTVRDLPIVLVVK